MIRDLAFIDVLYLIAAMRWTVALTAIAFLGGGSAFAQQNGPAGFPVGPLVAYPGVDVAIGHDNNLFIRSGGAQGEASGAAIPAGADPFVDATKFDFRLKAPTQPGKTLTPSYDGKDAFGTVRGVDGNWDRGAFEYK